MASSRPPSLAVSRSAVSWATCAWLASLLRAGLVQFLLGYYVGINELFAATPFGFGQLQIRPGPFQLGRERVDFRRSPAFGQIVQLRLCLREIFFRLGERGGFRLAFQFKQQLSGLNGIAPRDGEIGQRAAKRGGDINIFALDVALKAVG